MNQAHCHPHKTDTLRTESTPRRATPRTHSWGASMALCRAPECDGAQQRAGGLCEAHYKQLQRTGSLRPVKRRTLVERDRYDAYVTELIKTLDGRDDDFDRAVNAMWDWIESFMK